jgi:Leucine-rich repeat (LRR) protein
VNKKDPSEKLAIILSESKALVSKNERISNLLGEVVQDSLAILRRESALAQKSFKIGDYELLDPDYRQILLWSEDLMLDPLVVLKTLIQEKEDNWQQRFEFVTLNNGRLINIIMDLNKLPLKEIKWVDGIAVEKLWIRGNLDPECALNVSLKLPQIRWLKLPGLRLTELDLSCMPLLEYLDCEGNQITELNCSYVPRLRKLSCSYNHLSELDLSCLPMLENLKCSNNLLTELDLAFVPKLENLACENNRLTELEILNDGALGGLFVSENALNRLILPYLPNLKYLCCDKNNLCALDLSGVANLEMFDCSDNQIKTLDVSKVTQLDVLVCKNNVLTVLDVSKNRVLERIVYDVNKVRLIKHPDQKFDV